MNTTRKVILVAEDLQMTRDVLRFILSNRGFQVVEAVNGAVALEKARALVPDLVLLDTESPEMSGYDVYGS
jgi:CheY-like chemotaxis protein